MTPKARPFASPTYNPYILIYPTPTIPETPPRNTSPLTTTTSPPTPPQTTSLLSTQPLWFHWWPPLLYLLTHYACFLTDDPPTLPLTQLPLPQFQSMPLPLGFGLLRFDITQNLAPDLTPRRFMLMLHTNMNHNHSRLLSSTPVGNM